MVERFFFFFLHNLNRYVGYAYTTSLYDLGFTNDDSYSNKHLEVR